MKKILFLALHLGYGGTEKAITAEANLLSERYNVEIACVYRLYDEPAFRLNDNVKVHYLLENLKPNKEELKEAIRKIKPIVILKEGWKSVRVLWYRKSVIRKIVKETDADVIISTRALFHPILGKYKKEGVVTIAQEHNHHNNNKSYINKMVQSVKNIDYFMPVSKGLTEFYKERCKKTSCVYIPHSLDRIPEITSSLTERNVIAVGRMSVEKGFLDLIDVFAKISKNKPEWNLHIVGDGDQKSLVEKKIFEHGLETKVILHGYQRKDYVNQLLEKSSLYLMTSYTESFGISLIEAQSYGIPCIAYDSAQGALEIITDGENGYLIPKRDANLMCEKAIELMNDTIQRQSMGNESRKNALQYSVENVKQQWFAFVDNM